MSVTKREIERRFNTSDVEQVGSKQLFIVTTDTQTLLVSYYTIIGIYVGARWLLTTEKFSSTTSKQTNQFKASGILWDSISPDNLSHILCN